MAKSSVITFHSLEDRIVKTMFKITVPEICKICRRHSSGTRRISTRIKSNARKPILPSDSELSENNRSRSASYIAEKTKSR